MCLIDCFNWQRVGIPSGPLISVTDTRPASHNIAMSFLILLCYKWEERSIPTRELEYLFLAIVIQILGGNVRVQAGETGDSLSLPKIYDPIM